ncbi:hypothetical protein Goshw_020908 [Gossypium schwendimanii]|uniref:RNase H type-1 domain-containing protein n=1 Tax=Gossypium schwendimanii TaxID=34291 RepID=A0A7J9MDB4_GOSSC|nr:hypothetical protein [Gossypium schwendimanii]
MGEVIAIDWRDREGYWIEFIRVQVGRWRGGVEILKVNKTLHKEGGSIESTAEARGFYDATTGKRKVPELRQLLASKDLDINFLSKTRMWANELEHIRVRCRLEGYFFVESEGCKGGLVLLWKEMVDVRVQNHSMHHIYSVVKGAGQYHFRFTGFYGGRCKPRVALDDFQKGIEDLALVDIKIDRASWLDMVPFLSMEVVRQANSNHDAILLDSLGQVRSQLGLWQHRWFKRMKSRMHRLVDRIDRLIDGPCMDSNTEMLRTTRAELGVNGWSKRLLSYDGKDVFIKAMSQSLPSYAFSIILAPRGTTDEMLSKLYSFWWASKDKGRGWLMLAWDILCMPKGIGSLGLRDLRLFNLVLLGRQDVVWLLDKKAFEDLITILWNGWNCRNNAIFLDKDKDAREIPLISFVKVNVDVAVFNNKTRFGVIIHDSDGFILEDSEGYKEELMSVEWVKLDALIEGITLAHSLNFDMVIFESNCGSLVNHFRKHHNYITLLGHRVKDSRGMINLVVEAGVWIGRDSNRVADKICYITLNNHCNLSFGMRYLRDIHNLVIFYSS